MSMSTISRSRQYIYWVAMVAIALMAAPAFAQTPVATPTSIAFTYSYTPSAPGPAPLPQTVSIADASGNPLTITGTTLTQPVTSSRPLFQIQQNATSVIVAVPIQLLNASGLLTIGGTYTGSLRVTTAGGFVDVPLSLLLNQSVSLTATPSNLIFPVAVGSIGTQQLLTIASGVTNLSFSVTSTTANGVAWIVVNPLAGTTPATLAVNVNASGLTNGTYTGTVNISTGSGAALQVPVTMQVGTGTSFLTLNPASLNYNYAANTATAQQQIIYATNSFGAATYYATATTTTGTGWLTFPATNSTFMSGTFVGGQSTILVQANPANLSVGTYQGTVQVTSSDGATQSASVVMTVGTSGGGLLSISPSSVAFSAPTLNVSPNAQYVYVSSSVAGTTTYTAIPTTYNGGSWLTVNSTTFATGVLPTSLLIGANTFGMAAGTYSGQVSFSTSGATNTTQVIPVTLTVGFGGGTGTGGTIAPSSLTFSGQAGAANQPGTQYLALGGSGGLYTVTVTTTSGGSGWLSVPAESQNGSGPAFIPVAVSASGLTAGTFNGQITVNYGGITSTIPVTLTLSGGSSIVSNPGGAFINVYSTTSNIQQGLFLSMSDNSTPAFTVTSSAGWITTNLTRNTLPAQLTIIFNPAGLAGGLNSGTVSVTVAGAANTPLIIPVVMNNFAGSGSGGTGLLTFSPSSLGFSGQVGSAPAAQSVFVNASSFQTFTAYPTTSSGGSWLFVNPNSGQAPGGVVTVSVSTVGLSSGTYSGSISFAAGGFTQTAPVTLTIAGSGSTIAASPTSLSFDMQAGASQSSQTVNVTSTGASASVTVSAATSSGGTWLSATPGAGATPFNVQISANPAGLQAGTYSGTVTLAGSGTNSVSVPVTLTVRANPTVSATPASLTYTYRIGDAAPATQQIQVAAQNSTTPLTFSASVTSGSAWLSATPSGGTTPGTVNVNVTPGSLDTGTSTGTIVVAGTGGAGGSTTINVTITVTAPLPTVTRVVNNASYVSGALSPGEIVTISGSFIGPNEAASGGLDNSTNRIVTTLSGVQVLFNGTPGPILYVSSSQINAIVPYSVAGRLDTFVQVRYRGVTSNTITLPVTSAVPGVYTLNSSGSGPGAILNANGGVNGPGNPSDKNAVIVIYVTGEGIVQNANGARPDTGQIVNVASIADLPRPLLPVAVLIDGQPATVTYAGSAPGYVAGLCQINVVVPPTVNSGNVPIVISIGSNTSQAGVTVAVR